LGALPLLLTGAYRPLFSSVWVQRHFAERLEKSVVAQLPRPPQALSTSLWLQKC
jgi:hypothetical protein